MQGVLRVFTAGASNNTIYMDRKKTHSPYTKYAHRMYI